MHSEAVGAHIDTFVARCDPDAEPVAGEIGMYGVVGRGGMRTRLLITDDRAVEQLARLLPLPVPGNITVFGAAVRCAGLLDELTDWTPTATRPMVCRDLRSAPQPPLPVGMALFPVRRLPSDPVDGVQLADAVDLAARAAGESPKRLAEYLRSLQPAFRLHAAVDGDGVVRATSACGVFGANAAVIFVNTDTSWRQRGVGQAMTAHALYEAHHAGATQACLDSSDAGLSMYRRLDFTEVARAWGYSWPA